MVLLENYITTLAEFHQIGLRAAHLEFKNTCTIATHAQLQSRLLCSDYNVCTLLLQVHIIFQHNFDSICQKQIKKICTLKLHPKLAVSWQLPPKIRRERKDFNYRHENGNYL